MRCDPTGMKIIALDASHTVLVHMKLDSEILNIISAQRNRFWVLVC